MGPAVYACLICLLIGGAGVGYVWQKAAIDQLGRDRRKLEAHLIALQGRNKVAREQLAASQSPVVLEMRIKEMNLGLEIPRPSQVLRLGEPMPGTSTQIVDSPSHYMAMDSTGRAGTPPRKERKF
jgi:hypothetical protein